LVLFIAGIIAILGIYSAEKLPIDAFPDVTPAMVEIFTVAPGLATEEVEQFISYPIEVSLNGLPGVKEIRSLSKFGLSYVTVYFNDKSDIYFDRQLVFQRLAEAKTNIPEGFAEPPVMGPITTGLGQVYSYIVEGKGYNLIQLRTIQDWVVKYILRSVPGGHRCN